MRKEIMKETLSFVSNRLEDSDISDIDVKISSLFKQTSFKKKG
jgi:hypothetical protein